MIPGGFIPAVEKGIAEAMEHGELAGYPIKDVHVRLFDGSHHAVDSSEMAFKICASMAFKDAMSRADPALLEPIVKVAISVPEDAVGDVIGDLNSRRGHPLGMEPQAGETRIDAEVPMAEVLDYAPDLRAITGGRGEYTLAFERYERASRAPRRTRRRGLGGRAAARGGLSRGSAPRPRRARLGRRDRNRPRPSPNLGG